MSRTPSAAVPTSAWCLLVPAKQLVNAKSRLTDLAGDHRGELALAFARDTVTAVLACRRVARALVISDDAEVTAAAAALGAEVTGEPGTGLNPAVEYGVAVAARRWPGLATAVVCADLPALVPAQLELALDAAGRWDRAFLADQAGTGTTLLTAVPGVELAPAFGPGSRLRHRASGARELSLDGVESLRGDVDTGVDLAAAVALGVGTHTAAVLARTGLGLAGVEGG